MTSRMSPFMIIKTRKAFAMGGLVLLSLSGCASFNPSKTSLATATQAVRHGHYMEASQAYKQLAKNAHGTKRADFALKAADALVHAGALRAAQNELGAVATPLPSPLRARKKVLEAEIDAAHSEPAHALHLARQAAQFHALRPKLIAKIDRIEAQSSLRLGHPLAAAQALINREHLLTSQKRLTGNERALWQALTTVNPNRLRAVRRQTSSSNLRAWIRLALIAQEYPPQSRRLTQAISTWQNQYPKIQPTTAFLKSLTGTSVRPAATIRRIALLLPLTSPFAQATKAVERGFMDMATARPLPGQPHIVIYDIGSNPAQATHYYNEAVRDGAQFVVGPLGVDAVNNIAQNASIRVPTLLLGLAPTIVHNSHHVPVYQFSLARTQEARQIANRAYLDGHRRAAIFYPNTAWGHRMRKAFARRWRHLGGLVDAQESYTPGRNTYTKSVENLLNITESRLRHRRLEQILHMPLAFTARRRQDIGFVFLVADAPDGRLIKPQLNYDHADNLPVYSTSSIFTGRPDPVYDRDLDGITFGDMPWMLVANGRVGRLRHTLAHASHYDFTPLARLYAFGADAYALVGRLPQLALGGGARYQGLTGSLTVMPNGVVHRQLVWARFTRGLPQLVDTVLPYRGLFATRRPAIPAPNPNTTNTLP